MTKQEILKALEALPEDASIEDAIDRLVFLYKVNRGLQQAKAGQTIPHEEAKARMAKWLT
jgi:predicted transcriptional regulator